jgi:hypothetical protein
MAKSNEIFLASLSLKSITSNISLDISFTRFTLTQIDVLPTIETTVRRTRRSGLGMNEYVVVFLLVDIASTCLQERIANRVVSTAGRRDKCSLAVFTISHVADHIEILREQQEIHNILGIRTFHVAGEFNNARAKSIDDSLALLGDTHTRQVL